MAATISGREIFFIDAHGAVPILRTVPIPRPPTATSTTSAKTGARPPAGVPQ
jgi:hypothetical protein